jgi:hypothetical protein
MKIRPGKQKLVEAWNDGSLLIYPIRGDKCNYPAISVEVFDSLVGR